VRIAVTGSSGLIGTALGEDLRGAGHQVVPLVRRAARAGEISWDPVAGRLDPSDLSGIDAVVNLGGAGIGDARWTQARKRELVDSRVASTRLLVDAIGAAADRPGVLVSGSAVGYYGDRGDEVLTEASPPGRDFLGRLCVDWEAAAAEAEAFGVRVAVVRTGVVFARTGGALPRLAQLTRFGLGGRLGRGRQWMSWIALEDEVAAIVHLLTHDQRGAFDLTAPNPVRNADLTKALGDQLHRPTFLPVPPFGPRLVLGRERADNLLFVSQRALPERLLETGFAFRYPALTEALSHALQ